MGTKQPLKIAIIGGGFSGTALAANLSRLAKIPIEILLIDKTGRFGEGEAYSTPYPFHLLNVRADDMSAFADEPLHFVNWLNKNTYTHAYLDKNISVDEQFVPRKLYGDYLKYLLANLPSDLVRLKLERAEVIDVVMEADTTKIVLNDQRQFAVDKIILALGNETPVSLPFSTSAAIHAIAAWDYKAPANIPSHEPVLIIGTGLSMIDAVLTLHHQAHQGPIYAVSRRGLVPLLHARESHRRSFLLDEKALPKGLAKLIKYLRLISQSHVDDGGDWRAVIHAFRLHLPTIWQQSTDRDRKRFIRHVLPYWNIHRHRVHHKIGDLFKALITQGQLKILRGRVVQCDHKHIQIKLRDGHKTKIQSNWVINCTGPALHLTSAKQALIHALLRRGLAVNDPLNLGFDISKDGALKESTGQYSKIIYTLGPPAKAFYWETSAVPEIRKHCFNLAKRLLT